MAPWSASNSSVSTSSSDSIAWRVRRNPRAASRVARSWLTSFFTESVAVAQPQQRVVNRRQRSERMTPQNSRYNLRSNRRTVA